MNKNVLIPGNLISFQCEMCGNCCKNWAIHIDQYTYKNLIKAEEFENIEDKIEKFPKGTIDKYGYIKLDENKACKFLKDGLCDVHSKKGTDYLSDVCRVYPRIMIKSDRGMEVSSIFSCRAAVKCLDQKETIEFFMNPLGYRAYNMNNEPSIESKYYDKKSVDLYYLIEEILIDIVQYKKYRLRERMLLIGSFIEAIRNAKEEEKLQIIREYRNFIGENVKDIFSEIKCEKEDIIRCFKELAKSVVDMEFFIDKFSAYFNNLIENFESIEKKFFEDWEFDYIIENFFVGYIFRKNFFYGDQLIKEYAYMVINYIFILVDMNLKGDKSKNSVMESIRKCEKLLNHNLKFKKVFLEKRNEQDLIMESLKLSNFYV